MKGERSVGWKEWLMEEILSGGFWHENKRGNAVFYTPLVHEELLGFHVHIFRNEKRCLVFGFW